MKIRVCFLLFLVGALNILQAEVKPSKIFGDNMVLQRNLPIPIWGTADPGEAITVELNGQKETVRANAQGEWILRLRPIAAGENLDMKVSGSSTTTPVVFANVAMGEVWICSGQSNMEWTVQKTLNAGAEIQNANYPKIRLFQYPHKTSDLPLREVEGKWTVCNPETIPSFSAVAYFFGREIQERTHVPVGLIHTSWGGTPAEAWTRIGALESDPDFKPILDRYAAWKDSQSPEKQKVILAAWEKKLAEFTKIIDQMLASPGAPAQNWWNADDTDANWKTMTLPGLWQTQPGMQMNGSVWFRKDVNIPAEAAGKAAKIELGPVDDFDFTWINGTLVGNTNKSVKEFWKTPRSYPVPAGLLKEGKNVIIVRVIDHAGSGGFPGMQDQMALISDSGSRTPLNGEWQYQLEKNLGKAPTKPGGGPQYQPNMLYNAMLAPLIPYGIRGAIWYQGESNASRAEQYRKLFPAMIQNWRADWEQGDFPFYFVQLANYRSAKSSPDESDWAELREAQTMTLSLPNTGMATIIDIGEANDIHPKNKQDVGKRLALWALSKDYGITVATNQLGNLPGFRSFFRKPLEYSGPVYKNMQIKGSEITVCFDHISKGLSAKGDTLKGFAISGDDHKFVWAKAKISGSCITLSSPEVPNPKAVRYNWADNPDGNLYNSEGLPAVPFRTDNWPGITAGKL